MVVSVLLIYWVVNATNVLTGKVFAEDEEKAGYCVHVYT